MLRFARLLVVLLLLAPLLGPLGARAQNTAGYGDWQLHLPTNRPLHLADAGKPGVRGHGKRLLFQ